MQKFWQKVDRSRGPESCWIWTAACTAAGYGMFSVDRHAIYAHRYAYEAVNGPVPPGQALHHICEVRCCVNPDHLRPMLKGRHVAMHARRYVCKLGHKITGDNLRVDRHGKRYCRECQRLANAKRSR
jgi:hypothetical protein